MTAATRLLDRLDRPKQTAPGRWMAGCPCCQSRRGRPISVREADDGRVLLHPFCGCTTEDVLGAIGLGLGALFDRPLDHHFAPTSSRVPARDLLELLEHETFVAALLVEEAAAGHTLSKVARMRLVDAARRIGNARSA